MEDGTLEQGVARGLGALHGFLVGRSTLDEMLMAIASTAGAVVPDIDLASITMLREGEPTTPVCTDKIALDVDLAQYAFGDGPCLAAMRHQGTEVVDVARDTRWPPVTARAGELGVVGILIAAQHCSPDEAFDILRRVSQRENRKLRQVATDLVAKAQHLVDEPLAVGGSAPGHRPPAIIDG